MITPTQVPTESLLSTGTSATLAHSLRANASKPGNELKSTFQEFVGGTFYQLMLKSLHDMHDKPAYLHGGRAEEIFQGQLDQEMATHLAQTCGKSFSDSLYQQFLLQRSQNPSTGLPMNRE